MDFLNEIIKIENNKEYSGLTNELNIFCVMNYYQQSSDNVIVLTNTLFEANKIYKQLITYNNDTLLYPMDELMSLVAEATSPELKLNRLETINKLQTGTHNLVVTNLLGFLKKISLQTGKNIINVEVDKSINRDELIEKLENYGYRREAVVTSTGEYAIRGCIVDLFLTKYDHPIRIELFGDIVESIRFFDETSQMSNKKVNDIVIEPINELIDDDMDILYYFLNKPKVVILDEEQILASNLQLSHDLLDLKENHPEIYNLFSSYTDINIKDYIKLNTINKKNTGYSYETREIENFNGDFDLLKNTVDKYIKNGYKVYFFLSSKPQMKAIYDLFSSSVNIINKKINHGFIIDKYLVISEYDIDKVTNTEIKYRNNFHVGRKIKDYDQLEIGDYVVHSIHGIGIYNGLITLEKNGIKKDYLQINYLNNDKVYIPVEKINNIYKYSSKDGMKPHINQLNSTSWQRTKTSVRSRIKDISQDLIRLYAERNQIKSLPYKDYEEELIFANSFSYEETQDQTKAINDVIADLQSTRPMDRLLCGDVGFGKTEVAFRGMFKTVLNNQQVMYLCPTTILSKQQYESAKQRFKDYPIEIALLNRFTTKKESDLIKEGLSKGTIDIVFGTHRLLSDDIKIKNLGMLVVDEEQRFGVTHKEKIKNIKKEVNVLTLSATPIPRTLKMSMSGLRDLTIIDTPPVNRYPIQTYVMSENDLLIREAIYKELTRDGQVFILFNNISEMESKKSHIMNLVPDARVVSAHGQMTKTELENIMQDFIDYKYDILLCTTIIETGIDIPNANTLIVFDADHLGLSQLYQLRGRVGRSDKIAYAYLFYNQNKLLNDIAVKRLNAIKEFTELGSGYKIAMRDLSIRGAGDLLGSEQAGFVSAVGISLYMKMVDEEVRRLKGEEVLDEEEIEKPSLINVDTHISDNYVTDENIKIEIHQKINEVESYDSLIKVKNELEDRFGKISQSILIYMYEEWFEKIAEKLHINKVTQTDRLITIELPEEVSNKIKGDKLFMEAYSITPKFQFKYFNKRIIITLPYKQLEKHFLIYLIPLLDKTLRQIKDAEI